jgi:pyridoxamine 5'-phosphate oxidase
MAALLKAAFERCQGGSPAQFFVSLATVRAGGLPAVRTVVWRGFAFDDAVFEDLDASQPLPKTCMMFTTDARSAKMAEIAAVPFGEVMWYLLDSREQFRISGPLTAVTANAAPATGLHQRQQAERIAIWTQLSLQTRQQFVLPGHPGQHDIKGGETPPLQVPEDSLASPPDTFVVLKLKPTAIDHLVVTNPNKRTLYKLTPATGDWSENPVRP